MPDACTAALMLAQIGDEQGAVKEVCAACCSLLMPSSSSHFSMSATCTDKHVSCVVILLIDATVHADGPNRVPRAGQRAGYACRTGHVMTMCCPGSSAHVNAAACTMHECAIGEKDTWHLDPALVKANHMRYLWQ